jgi:hypothetical protein
MLNERLQGYEALQDLFLPLAILEVISLITSSGDVAFLSENFLTPRTPQNRDSTVSNIVIIIIYKALGGFASLFSISL